MAIPIGIILVDAGIFFHRFPPAYDLANYLGGWFIAAAGQAAFWSLVWHRQRDRYPLANVARGASGGAPEAS
jgi:hypothetical protein